MELRRTLVREPEGGDGLSGAAADADGCPSRRSLGRTTGSGAHVVDTVRSPLVSPATFPNFAGKHALDAVFSPGEAVAQFLQDGELVVPRTVVLTYQAAVPRYLSEQGNRVLEGWPLGRLWVVERPGRELVGVLGGFGIGAPAAALVLELLIVLGAQRFVSLGAAGCLQPEIGLGEVVVASAAVRDEGLSHHYLPIERFAHPSPELTRHLARTLETRGVDYHRGPTWTIDAIFRETVAEARSYQAEGIVTVDMEAAALFTVASYRGVQLASAFVVSDHLLAAERWTHILGSRQLAHGLETLLEAALDTLGAPEASTAGSDCAGATDGASPE